MQTVLGTIALLTLIQATPMTDGQWDDKLTVAQAARLYRIETYERFRFARDEYNARREVGDELFNRWIKAKEPNSSEAAVINWYRAAAQISAENSQQLPSLPKIFVQRKSFIPASTEKRSSPVFLDTETIKVLNEAAKMSPNDAEPQDVTESSVDAVDISTETDAEPEDATNVSTLDRFKRALLRATGLNK